MYCWYGIFNQRLFGKFSFNFVFSFYKPSLYFSSADILLSQVLASLIIRLALAETFCLNCGISRRADYKCEPISSVSFFDNTAQLTAVN